MGLRQVQPTRGVWADSLEVMTDNDDPDQLWFVMVIDGENLMAPAKREEITKLRDQLEIWLND